jgi:ABC-type branched-subunit amino acid transport system ATPase component/ABC-type branched-subunit amino acid transport system permease subunit
LVLATLITAVVGGIVGLPALRTRGVTLAVATLGLGGALSAVVLANPKYTGGVTGISVSSPTLFGWSLDPFEHPDRYAFVTLTIFVLLGLMVANIRRGVTGRRLLAVRSNERAAASLGVHVSWVKAYAFVLAAGIAAIGGIMLAFVQPSIQLSPFDVFTCILVVAVTVTGGVGFVPGALAGALMISGGVVTKLLHSWSQINDYLPLVGGVLLILTLMFAQNGLFEANRLILMRLLKPLAVKGGRWGRRMDASKPLRPATISRVPARSLTVRGVSVSFGGLQAVDEVSLEVRPGEIHGLIGPNGAGKTTLIDAITGFAKASRGTVQLGDVDISSWPARKRSSAGLARSFQSLELFTDLTVRENLAVASEHSGALRYLFDLVRPKSIRLSDAALEALHQFELQDLVDVRPSDVSFGQRKTVAIARSIARSPSVLLLDEPAAGLDDREADELAVLIRHLADAWGVAVLLVEHKVDMIMSISDRVTVLDAGRVLAAGTPAEVRANADVLDAYLGRTAPASALTAL